MIRKAGVALAATFVVAVGGIGTVAFAQSSSDPVPPFPGVLNVTPVPEPETVLEDARHAAAEELALADLNSIICVDAAGGLVGMIEVNRDPGAPPIDLQVKQETCEQAFGGSRAAE